MEFHPQKRSEGKLEEIIAYFTSKINADPDNALNAVQTIDFEGVSSFDLNFTYYDLNNDPSANEVAAIGVGFNMAGVGKEFRTQIFPRTMVQEY